MDKVIIESLKDLERHYKVKPRSMTRAERQRFREEKLDPQFLDLPEDISTNEKRLTAVELQEKIVDWVLTNVYGDVDIDWDNISYGVQTQLTDQTYKLTYGIDPKALKNS